VFKHYTRTMILPNAQPGSDNAPWRKLLLPSTSEPPESELQETGDALAKFVISHPEILGYVVGELVNQCNLRPQHIDALLAIYKHMALLLNPAVSAHGCSGTEAAYKALDLEIYERAQRAGVPIALAEPYDVSCPLDAPRTRRQLQRS